MNKIYIKEIKKIFYNQVPSSPSTKKVLATHEREHHINHDQNTEKK